MALKWRRLQWLTAAVVFCVGAWLVVDAYLHQRRVQWLVSEISAVQAHVSWPQSPLQQLLHGNWPRFGGGVLFEMAWNIEPGWLHDHDYLRGLSIQRLALCERPPSQSEIATLVQLHPIQQVSAREYADEIAIPLKHCRTLQQVDFEQSELSDLGFRELPFEQLCSINIADCRVSPAGLQLLSRCRNLKLLSIDSDQIEAAVSVLIESRIPIETLEIRDPSVDDWHLRRLHELPLRCLELRGISVSDDAVKMLQQKSPECTITIN